MMMVIHQKFCSELKKVENGRRYVKNAARLVLRF
jgi:hypothetical protein